MYPITSQILCTVERVLYSCTDAFSFLHLRRFDFEPAPVISAVVQ
jgi:hypothetical protein